MSLVVNIRGTGGSGKSTVVRRVMETWRERVPFYCEGRRQPTLYARKELSMRISAVALGHYETPCGGCDTFKTVDAVFDLVREHAALSCTVLFEGIMVGDDVRRTVELAQAGHRVVVIGLTTPLEDCLTSIEDRRHARGDDRPLDPKNTASRAARLERHYVRLREGGCEVERLDREGAYARVVELLSA